MLERGAAMMRWIRYKSRRRLGPLRACLLVLVIAGFVGLVSAGAATSTRIVGGSAAERELLRQIVAKLGRTRIPELRIVPVVGGVKLQTHVTAIRPSWDALIVGGTFLGRSAQLGLPPLLEVDAGQAGWPTSNAGSTKPPIATALSQAAARRTMLQLVDATGARPAELSILKPYALAVALRLQVDDAASFLHHRLRSFVLQASKHQARYEGQYIEVDDAHGAAWISAETRLGGIRHVRPGLRGCDPFPTPTPIGPSPTPPCPA
jgi:hypothetical protein